MGMFKTKLTLEQYKQYIDDMNEMKGKPSITLDNGSVVYDVKGYMESLMKLMNIGKEKNNKKLYNESYRDFNSVLKKMKNSSFALKKDNLVLEDVDDTKYSSTYASLLYGLRDVAKMENNKEAEMEIQKEIDRVEKEEKEYKESINEEFKKNDSIVLEDVNDTLNPNLWTSDNELKPEVKEKILDVVDYFVAMLKEDEVDLVINDVVILGSNANYNYNEDSDIDVHIIANTEETKCPDLEYKLLQAYKTMFNYKHDVEIKGHEIELYVEENEVHAKSNGIYSLYEDKWLKVPKKEQVPNVDINDELNKWLTKFFNVEDNPTLDNVNDFLDDIYKLRQTSIEQDGEYGVGNLIFKKLRGFGFIDELKNLLVKLEDKKMSLEGLNGDSYEYSDEELSRKYQQYLDIFDTIPVGDNNDLDDWEY